MATTATNSLSTRAHLAELARYRDLLRQLVVRELKVRYKNSAFGFLWSIVPPVLQVLVYSFVFRSVLNVAAPNYSAYLLCGMIPWTFAQATLLDSSMSVLVNYPMIKKIYMPREVFPLHSVISNFIHFLLAWGVFFAYFCIVARALGIGGLPYRQEVWLFPVITFFLACFVTGMSLWLCALRVFYDDVTFILQTLFNLLLFLIPVLYPVDSIYYSNLMQKHPWLFKLYMLNPVTAFIEAYRKTILQPIARESFGLKAGQEPLTHVQWDTFAGACLLSVLILWLGYRYFNGRKWQFVERP